MGRELKRVPLDFKWPLNKSYKDEDIPSGDGYQMWSDVCDNGSPISPVCKTKEDLAEWLFENKASANGEMTASKEAWLEMIEQGWCPSMLMVGGKFISGVEACLLHKKKLDSGVSNDSTKF